MAGAAPILRRLPGARQVVDAADRAGVDATALWYTESAATDRAEARLRHSSSSRSATGQSRAR